MLWKSKIESVVRQVVDICLPIRVILFGSCLTGRNANDIDLLVVLEDERNIRDVSQQLYREVKSVGVPVDFIVCSKGQFEQEKDQSWSVICSANQKGKDVYVA